MIAAKGGDSNSLRNIRVSLFSCGYIDIKHNCVRRYATKDDYAKALRSYQSYLDEIKSGQRDEAAAES